MLCIILLPDKKIRKKNTFYKKEIQSCGIIKHEFRVFEYFQTKDKRYDFRLRRDTNVL